MSAAQGKDVFTGEINKAKDPTEWDEEILSIRGLSPGRNADLVFGGSYEAFSIAILMAKLSILAPPSHQGGR